MAENSGVSHVPYLRDVVNPAGLNKIINGIVEKINEKFPDATYVAGTGVSGISVLGGVCYLTKKRMFIVRKPDDKHNHSFDHTRGKLRECEFENSDCDHPTAVIVDDLVCMGDTVERVCEILNKCGILPLGIILYFESGKDVKISRPTIFGNPSFIITCLDESMD